MALVRAGYLFKFPSEGPVRASSSVSSLGPPRRYYFLLTEDTLRCRVDEASPDLPDLGVALNDIAVVARGIARIGAASASAAAGRDRCLNIATAGRRRHLFLQAATEAERDEWVTDLVRVVFEQGNPPPFVLNSALLRDCTSAAAIRHLRYVLSLGADVNCRGAQGTTPLLEAARAGNEAAVRELLGAGADARLQTQSGETALTVAAFGGCHGVVHLLLTDPAAAASAAGAGATGGESASPGAAPCAYINLPTADGRTPLHLACCHPTPHPGTVATLLAHGALAYALDSTLQTPLHAMCARHPPTLDLSLPGAAESVHSAEFDTCSMLIKACAAAVGWTDAEGYTPLMLAAWHGHMGCVRALLVVGGADPLEGTGQRTALGLARAGGHLRCAQLMMELLGAAQAQADGASGGAEAEPVGDSSSRLAADVHADGEVR